MAYNVLEYAMFGGGKIRSGATYQRQIWEQRGGGTTTNGTAYSVLSDVINALLLFIRLMKI